MISYQLHSSKQGYQEIHLAHAKSKDIFSKLNGSKYLQH